MTNRFQFIHRFFNYQLFDLSTFAIEAKLVTQITIERSYSFYEPETERHLVDVYYCGAITDEAGDISTTATLSFTFDGDHASNSPMTVNMIPGPCK